MSTNALSLFTVIVYLHLLDSRTTFGLSRGIINTQYNQTNYKESAQVERTSTVVML